MIKTRAESAEAADQVRVALLEAHARVATASARDASCAMAHEDSVVRARQASHLPQLYPLWAGLLRDHVALSTLPRCLRALYKPSLMQGVEDGAAEAARPHLQAAWPTTLAALTCAAQNASGAYNKAPRQRQRIGMQA